MAAEMAQCPLDCTSQCVPFENSVAEELTGTTMCQELGILSNYREPCGSYYSDFVSIAFVVVISLESL